MEKLALHMIVKDDTEAAMLQRCLASIAPHVDGVFVTITNKPDTKLKKVIETYNGVVSYFKWTKSFEEARNYSLSQVPEEYKYVVWTDSDDVWDHADGLKNIVKIMEERNMTGAFFDYNYQINPDTGKIEIVHPRERVVLRDQYHWKGHLHETLICKRDKKNEGYYKNIWVNHFPSPTSGEDNLARNLEILEQTYKNEGDEHDPRTEYYLARNYFDVGKLDEALDLFKDYLKHSGWAEERAFAWNYMGLIHIANKEPDLAKQCFLSSIDEYPQHPTWYVNMSYLYCFMERYEEAIHYSRLFINTPKPKSTTVYLPIDDEVRYYECVYMIGLAKGKVDEAIEAVNQILALVPAHDHYKGIFESLMRLKTMVSVTKGVESIAKELEFLGEGDDLLPKLLRSLPSSVQDNAYIAMLRTKYLPPTKWEENTIAYWTGKSFEQWTPKSLESGLGGSETAVVQLSKNWAKEGQKVTVFNNSGAEEGTYDNVEYVNYYRFNRFDEFDTLVIWRAPWDLDKDWNAKRIWLDLHDVINPEEITEERNAKVDKYFVKSEYHKNMLPEHAQKKAVVIPNGVDKSFAKLDKGKQKPQRLIYASSYDRGLEHMLRFGWPTIKEQVPNAELHIYYGWNLFDTIHKNNPERMAWKAGMLELMSQDGIIEHGRVGQEELLKAKAKANIHYYGCTFEEIDCISVRESALVGCIPFTTDYAALKDRPYCMTTKGDPKSRKTHVEIANQIVKYMKDPEALNDKRNEFKALAKEEFWGIIASKWLEHAQNQN